MTSADTKAAQVAARLADLRDAINALPSLKPGQGYDAIGAELCSLIFEDYTPQEKDEIIRLLDEKDPAIIRDIRRASIESEMAMEQDVIDRIAARSPEERLPAAMRDEDLVIKFRHVTRDYPYSWGFSRAEEQRGLIEHMSGRALSPDNDAFLLHGRTMLPWSGLSLHLLTGAPVFWIDPFEDSAAAAKIFIGILEDLGLLHKGAFTVVHEKESEAVERGLAGLKDRTIHSFVLDKDYDVSNVYKMFRARNVSSLMLTQTHGLTQLMYPPYDLKPLSGLFNLEAVLVPPHAQGTVNFPNTVKVIEGTKKDVFLSTMYFKPA